VERDVWLMVIGSVVSAIVAVPVAWAFFLLQERSAEQQADKQVNLILRALELGLGENEEVEVKHDAKGRITGIVRHARAVVLPGVAHARGSVIAASDGHDRPNAEA
jgi:hypothetical protein